MEGKVCEIESAVRWGDIMALNFWASLRSKAGWIWNGISFVILWGMLASLMDSMEWKVVYLSFAITSSLVIAMVFVSIFFFALWASGHFLVKGCTGWQRITFDNKTIESDSGRKITAVPWKNIRSIDKFGTRIFVRVSRWKFFIIPGRAFAGECEFVQYYADLVRAWHENR